MLYITRLLINLLVVNLFCVFFISPSLCVTLNMSQTRGACGHIKGVFDTHVTCLSCLGCSFDKQCDVCDKWTAETWKFVRARRTHKSRKSKISISSPSSSFSGFSFQDAAEDFVSDGNANSLSKPVSSVIYDSGAAAAAPTTLCSVQSNSRQRAVATARSRPRGKIQADYLDESSSDSGQALVLTGAVLPGHVQSCDARAGTIRRSDSVRSGTVLPGPTRSGTARTGAIHRPGSARPGTVLPGTIHRSGSARSGTVLPGTSHRSGSDRSGPVQSDHARPGSVRPGRSKIRLADFVIPRRQSPSPPSVSRRSSQTSVRHSRSTNRSEVKRRRVYVPSSSESESDVPVQINQFDSDDDDVVTHSVTNQSPLLASLDKYHPIIDASAPSDQEEDPWSFAKATTEVYNILDDDLCPKPPTTSALRRPISGVEKLLGSRSKQPDIKLLPHSPVVADTLTLIEEVCSSRAKTDWSISSQELRSLAPVSAYKVHSPAFPEKVPTLDANATKVGITSHTRCQLNAKTLESWESRARTLVTIASHADLFATASFALLQAETFSPIALQRLLEASGRAARHSAALALSLSAEILHKRRDVVLETSNVLTPASKDMLRAAPLNAPQLLGGLIEEVIKTDVSEHQHRLMATNKPMFSHSAATRAGPFRGMSRRGPTPSYGRPRFNSVASPYRGRSHNTRGNNSARQFNSYPSRGRHNFKRP